MCQGKVRWGEGARCCVGRYVSVSGRCGACVSVRCSLVVYFRRRHVSGLSRAASLV